MSALFISYTGRDPEGDAWADRLEEWCGEWGYGFFRDRHPGQGVKAGDDWRASLNRHLSRAQVVISLCSPSYELSSWCMWELAAAEERGKWIIPIQLSHQKVPSLLGHRQVIRVANARQPTASELAEVKERLARVLREQLDWRMLQPWDPSRSPYPGLLAFEAEQAPVFFGQDKAIEKLGERLASLAQRAPAALLVLGASGTGKSSLMRAGVLPRLAADRDRWQLLAPFRPGLMPFTRLRKVLAPALAAFPEAPPGPAHEAEVIALGRQLDWLQAQAERPVLLVIDQLEELLVEGNPEAERFLAFLEGQLCRELSGLVVLATLRTDFLAVLERRWPGLTELVETTTPEPILPQCFGELISGPAARADLRLQPGLAERLVAESGGRGALPLLAFTLEKLWRKRQEREAAVVGPNGARWDLTLADLETLGGVAGVVGTQAALCWDLFTSDVAESEALKQAFVHHLVRLNEEGLATKQQARWGDLPALSRPLLKRFVEARLLVSGGGDSLDQIEIAHEALLSVWEPLVGWIKEGRQELEQRRRVARLCGDLALSQTPKTRLASLQSLLALAETNAWAVAQAAVALEEVLVQSERDSLEWSLAIQVLAMVGDEMSVKVLIAFLEQRQLFEPLDPIHAASLLNALCQAAAGLQNIYRRRPPTSEETARWLLLPSATVSDDGRAMRTELVRIRLWATPRLENPGAWLEPLGNGLALTMVRMPPGNFLMGSSADELDRKDNECPQHLVTLESFLISQTLITQAQWRQVMNTNPSQFKDKKTDRDHRPVERVSWHDAMAFCTELSDRSGRKYNLPSEAQWEYACRAGTTLAFNFGNTVTSVLGNVSANNINLESSSVLYRFQTSPVAHYPSNRWGLHDMHGNVEEWCLDYWNPRYQEVTVDESSWVSPLREDGDENELHRVLRGGSWLNLFPWDCRSASRNHNHPDYAEFHVGFRVVCLC